VIRVTDECGESLNSKPRGPICYPAHMSMIFLTLLGFLALGLYLRKRRTGARVVVTVGAVLFFAVGCGPLPDELLHQLQSGYEMRPIPAWQPRVAIIVLGGGLQRMAGSGAAEIPLAAYGRVLEALDLYLQCKRAGKACSLLVSGGDPLGAGVSEARVYGDALLKVGVDPSDLVLERRSLNTWQNAQYCAAWLDEHPQGQVLLVTSGFHLRRGVLYFAHFGVHVLPVRSDFVSAPAAPMPQAHNFLLMDLALHEYAGLWRYRIYSMLGWNSAAQLPRSIS
jgi:uncharacterized SAM-binding protein YcdF (DUF218 family)